MAVKVQRLGMNKKNMQKKEEDNGTEKSDSGGRTSVPDA